MSNNYNLYEINYNEFKIRFLKIEDTEEYFKSISNVDDEVSFYTNTTIKPNLNQISDYIEKCVHSKERFDFIITNQNNDIIAESVLMDYDEKLRSAHYRVAIFFKVYLNRGIGTWMIKEALKFGFETLNLHRIELEVYSFNNRAIRTYEKLGFKKEGVLRDTVIVDNKYHDTIIMAILENEWTQMSKTNLD